MSRPRKTQAERSGETRERILSAAAEIVISRGYAGFRVNDVAEAAGVSRGAQLHHFATKEILVAEALKRVFFLSHEVNHTRISRVRQIRSFSARHLVEEVIAGAKDFYFDRNFMFILDMALSASKDGDIADIAREIILTEGRKNETEWLDLLKDFGLDPVLAQDMLWMLWSAVRGIQIRRLSSDAGRAQLMEDRVLGKLTETIARDLGDVVFSLAVDADHPDHENLTV